MTVRNSAYYPRPTQPVAKNTLSDLMLPVKKKLQDNYFADVSRLHMGVQTSMTLTRL